MRKSIEHKHQCGVIRWCKTMEVVHPELKLIHAIPNGGARNIATGAMLKREGVKAGVPDLFLPVPKNDYHGLYIEMKAGKNKPTQNQCWWAEQLQYQGYRVCLCYSSTLAIRAICDYLRLPYRY